MSISKLRGGKTAFEQQKRPTNRTKNGVTVAATPSTTTTATTTATATNTVGITVTVTSTATTTMARNPTTPTSVSTVSGLPQTTVALLKIEPCMPSSNARLRRPISRSYSTLDTVSWKRPSNGIMESNGNINNTLALPKGAPQAVGGTRLRRQPVPVLTRRRSKSSAFQIVSPAAQQRPNTAANNVSSNGTEGPSNEVAGAIVTTQANGICRIMRAAKEQEQLPDRINYDRRGLTAIPIFEREPHLRLLSLQHNLINVFHIPKHTSPTDSPTVLGATEQSNEPHEKLSPESQEALSVGAVRTQRNLMRATGAWHTRLGAKPHSPTPPPPPTPTKTTAALLNVQTKTANQQLLLRRNGVLTRAINFPANAAPAIPPPQPQSPAVPTQSTLQYRYGMRRAKSFVSNYAARKGTLMGKGIAGVTGITGSSGPVTESQLHATLTASVNLKSFDSGASGLTSDSTSSTLLTNSEVEDDPNQQQTASSQLQQQLQIKNKQLQYTYGTIFQYLVFLDLYDNQIERIANLDGLPQLSVLLLGKNRISDISGLSSLRYTLRVLDLHGNKLTSISNKLNCLTELKSLNLAGNQIRQINANDFNGLLLLRELNLKRNRIRRINGFQHLTALERLWLCHNELHRVEDMASIGQASNLLEVTIEHNPVSLAGDCVSFLVSYLPRLQSLSQMAITAQVRRAAMAWRKHKELAVAQGTTHAGTDIVNSIRREEVISNARTNWELLRSQQNVQALTLTGARNQRSPKPRELAKISESNEVDETLLNYEAELQEFIKLPPIQKQQQTEAPVPVPAASTLPTEKPQQSNEIEMLAHMGVKLKSGSASSTSSLGPNVDSSSSCYSSDNEESSPQQQQTERTKVKKAQRRTPTKQERTIETPATIDNENNNNSSTSSSSASIVPNADAAITKTIIESTDLALIRNNQTTDNNANDGILVMDAINNETRTTTTTAAAPANANNNNTISNISNLRAQCRIKSAVPTTTATATATSTTTTTTICKRYMSSSLMRSHTIVGCTTTTTSAGVSGTAAIPVGGKQANPSKSNVSLVLQPQHQPLSTTTTTSTTIAHNNNNSNNNKSLSSSSSSSLIVGGVAAAATAAATAAGPSSSKSNNANNNNNTTTTTAGEREREQGGDYLIEICGRYLNVYGQGALRFIDKQWSAAKANDVHTLNFSYINFNNIAAVLSRIRVRFPHAENYVFRETNISCLGQLNALAELQGIASLSIDPEGNAITTKDLWRQYAIYRLSHWGLRQLNGSEVSDADVQNAHTLYAGLSELVLWSLPDAMLQPLLARLRLDETCTASRLTPKEWLMRADSSLRLVVGKEALQWKKLNTQQQQSYYANETQGSVGGAPSAGLSIRERGKQHFALMLENTCNAVEKLHKLEALWPNLLLDIVRNTLLDYAQLDGYMRQLMSELMKQ